MSTYSSKSEKRAWTRKAHKDRNGRPQARRWYLVVRLTREEWRDIKAHAKAQDVNLSDWVRGKIWDGRP